MIVHYLALESLLKLHFNLYNVSEWISFISKYMLYVKRIVSEH